MDIRIINSEGNMFAIGDRTLRVNGRVLCLLDRNNQLETIEVYEGEEIARGIRDYIIKEIEENFKNGKKDMIIETVSMRRKVV